MIARLTAAAYGMVCYIAGMAALGYTALWLIDLVPNALDAPRSIGIVEALFIDLLLIGLFVAQHSGMARPAFKRWWTRYVPVSVERSTYVLASSVAMALMFLYWEPIGIDIWRIDSGVGYAAILAAYACGWAVLVSATFFINHFDLFGLRQVWFTLRGTPYQELTFAARGLYRVIRHPIYLGWFLVIWITPVMSASHLFFALASTGYILWAVRLEERDLLASLPEYAAYRDSTPMVIPGPRKARPATPA
jgi:methanethiol S-methyltransferase